MSLVDPTAWEARGRRVRVFGHDVFVVTAGNPAAPPLLLLHGYPSSSHDFSGCIDTLAERFHVVAHDHLGFGLSAKPAAFSGSLIEQAEVALGLWQALGVTHGHVVAHDYGTSVATDHPRRRARRPPEAHPLPARAAPVLAPVDRRPHPARRPHARALGEARPGGPARRRRRFSGSSSWATERCWRSAPTPATPGSPRRTVPSRGRCGRAPGRRCRRGPPRGRAPSAGTPDPAWGRGARSTSWPWNGPGNTTSPWGSTGPGGAGGSGRWDPFGNARSSVTLDAGRTYDSDGVRVGLLDAAGLPGRTDAADLTLEAQLVDDLWLVAWGRVASLHRAMVPPGDETTVPQAAAAPWLDHVGAYVGAGVRRDLGRQWGLALTWRYALRPPEDTDMAASERAFWAPDLLAEWRRHAARLEASWTPVSALWLAAAGTVESAVVDGSGGPRPWWFGPRASATGSVAVTIPLTKGRLWVRTDIGSGLRDPRSTLFSREVLASAPGAPEPDVVRPVWVFGSVEWAF